MHVKLNFNFKLVLYSSILVIKVSKNCFKSIFLLWKWNLVFFQNALLHYATPIFITEVLRLAANAQLLKQLFYEING